MCASCISLDTDWHPMPFPDERPVDSDISRGGNEEVRNVLLLYSAGYTVSLPSYLKEDIEDLAAGWLPGNLRNDNVLLVYSHLPVRSSDLSTPTSPVLFRLYSDEKGMAVRDTLRVYEAGTISASAAQLEEVLTFVKDEFPANGYGMIFSSHATGYLPSGYYNNPEEFMSVRKGRQRIPAPVPYVEPEHDPSLPAVKSIGADISSIGGTRVSYEMELKDFAEAIPMELDYILFDACLMGGVEAAYELRGVCKAVGFSQTEVLAEGFDYKTLSTHLLGGRTPDPAAVCEDYFLQYDTQSGVYRSATISLVSPMMMDDLADVCSELFEKYRNGLSMIDPESVQQYFRYSYHWFYDMESIIQRAAEAAGATQEEIGRDMETLHEALDRCILYKAATPRFMETFTIETYSGLSMYLPCDGSPYLDMHYRNLKWNETTGLVK